MCSSATSGAPPVLPLALTLMSELTTSRLYTLESQIPHTLGPGGTHRLYLASTLSPQIHFLPAVPSNLVHRFVSRDHEESTWKVFNEMLFSKVLSAVARVAVDRRRYNHSWRAEMETEAVRSEAGRERRQRAREVQREVLAGGNPSRPDLHASRPSRGHHPRGRRFISCFRCATIVTSHCTTHHTNQHWHDTDTARTDTNTGADTGWRRRLVRGVLDQIPRRRRNIPRP